jgi:hypothetical protein
MVTTRHRDALATTEVAGKVEIATTAETNTGTSTTLVPSVDAVAGSVFGEKNVGICPFKSDTAVSIGDGTIGFCVPASMNLMVLVAAVAGVDDKGITNTTNVQLRRRRGGVDADMLSTLITIGDEFFAADGVIDLNNDDLLTGDILYVDVDAIHTGTAPNGLFVTMTFRLP